MAHITASITCQPSPSVCFRIPWNKDISLPCLYVIWASVVLLAVKFAYLSFMTFTAFLCRRQPYLLFLRVHMTVKTIHRNDFFSNRSFYNLGFACNYATLPWIEVRRTSPVFHGACVYSFMAPYTKISSFFLNE